MTFTLLILSIYTEGLRSAALHNICTGVEKEGVS